MVAYGLDFAERCRTLPYVGVVSEGLIPELVCGAGAEAGCLLPWLERSCESLFP